MARDAKGLALLLRLYQIMFVRVGGTVSCHIFYRNLDRELNLLGQLNR
jgi:hypothetical protein